MNGTSFWPDTEQTILLHAVLDEDARANAFVMRWLETVDFDALDAGSQRLMPLLHGRLQSLGVEHPLAPRIRGMFRRSWYMDQRLRRQLRLLRTALDGARIDCILLKGAALGPTVYRHGAFRPADDIDLMVRPEKFDQAAELLAQTGWRHEVATQHASRFASEVGSVDVRVRPVHEAAHARAIKPHDLLKQHASSYKSELGSVDLHVSPYHEAVRTRAIEALWATRRRVVIDGAPADILSAHDQLLHTLAHGLRANPMPPIRWVADATLIVRHEGERLDWDRFLHGARELGFTLVAMRALTFLATEFAAGVPPRVLDRLASTPKSLPERIEFHCARRDRFRLLAKWALTYREVKDAGVLARARLVVGQYRDHWQSPDTAHLLGRALVRLLLGRRRAARFYARPRRGPAHANLR